MTEAASDISSQRDIAALAKGGRTNFFGFLLRLAARLPFLLIAGRLYGPDALGRGDKQGGVPDMRRVEAPAEDQDLHAMIVLNLPERFP